MRVPSGAPVGDGNMGTVVKDLRSQIDVLSRRLSRLPKPTDSTGSPMGSARAVATVSGGAGLIDVSGWEFTTYEWPNSEPPVLVGSTSGHFNVSESGWYSVRAHLGIGWSSPPAEVTYLLNPATTTAMSDTAQYVGTVPVAASGDLFIDIPTSVHFYYGDGLDPSLGGVGLFGLDVEWAGGATPSFVEVWLDVTRTG